MQHLREHLADSEPDLRPLEAVRDQHEPTLLHVDQIVPCLGGLEQRRELAERLVVLGIQLQDVAVLRDRVPAPILALRVVQPIAQQARRPHPEVDLVLVVVEGVDRDLVLLVQLGPVLDPRRHALDRRQQIHIARGLEMRRLQVEQRHRRLVDLVFVQFRQPDQHLALLVGVRQHLDALLQHLRQVLKPLVLRVDRFQSLRRVRVVALQAQHLRVRARRRLPVLLLELLQLADRQPDLDRGLVVDHAGLHRHDLDRLGPLRLVVVQPLERLDGLEVLDRPLAHVLPGPDRPIRVRQRIAPQPRQVAIQLEQFVAVEPQRLDHADPDPRQRLEIRFRLVDLLQRAHRLDVVLLDLEELVPRLLGLERLFDLVTPQPAEIAIQLGAAGQIRPVQHLQLALDLLDHGLPVARRLLQPPNVAHGVQVVGGVTADVLPQLDRVLGLVQPGLRQLGQVAQMRQPIVVAGGHVALLLHDLAQLRPALVRPVQGIQRGQRVGLGVVDVEHPTVGVHRLLVVLETVPLQGADPQQKRDLLVLEVDRRHQVLENDVHLAPTLALLGVHLVERLQRRHVGWLHAEDHLVDHLGLFGIEQLLADDRSALVPQQHLAIGVLEPDRHAQQHLLHRRPLADLGGEFLHRLQQPVVHRIEPERVRVPLHRLGLPLQVFEVHLREALHQIQLVQRILGDLEPQFEHVVQARPLLPLDVQRFEQRRDVRPVLIRPRQALELFERVGVVRLQKEDLAIALERRVLVAQFVLRDVGQPEEETHALVLVRRDVGLSPDHAGEVRPTLGDLVQLVERLQRPKVFGIVVQNLAVLADRAVQRRQFLLQDLGGTQSQRHGLARVLTGRGAVRQEHRQLLPEGVLGRQALDLRHGLGVVELHLERAAVAGERLPRVTLLLLGDLAHLVQALDAALDVFAVFDQRVAQLVDPLPLLVDLEERPEHRERLLALVRLAHDALERVHRPGVRHVLGQHVGQLTDRLDRVLLLVPPDRRLAKFQFRGLALGGVLDPLVQDLQQIRPPLRTQEQIVQREQFLHVARVPAENHAMRLDRGVEILERRLLHRRQLASDVLALLQALGQPDFVAEHAAERRVILGGVVQIRQGVQGPHLRRIEAPNLLVDRHRDLGLAHGVGGDPARLEQKLLALVVGLRQLGFDLQQFDQVAPALGRAVQRDEGLDGIRVAGRDLEHGPVVVDGALVLADLVAEKPRDRAVDLPSAIRIADVLDPLAEQLRQFVGVLQNVGQPQQPRDRRVLLRQQQIRAAVMMERGRGVHPLLLVQGRHRVVKFDLALGLVGRLLHDAVDGDEPLPVTVFLVRRLEERRDRGSQFVVFEQALERRDRLAVLHVDLEDVGVRLDRLFDGVQALLAQLGQTHQERRPGLRGIRQLDPRLEDLVQVLPVLRATVQLIQSQQGVAVVRADRQDFAHVADRVFDTVQLVGEDRRRLKAQIDDRVVVFGQRLFLAEDPEQLLGLIGLEVHVLEGVERVGVLGLHLEDVAVNPFGALAVVQEIPRRLGDPLQDVQAGDVVLDEAQVVLVQVRQVAVLFERLAQVLDPLVQRGVLRIDREPAGQSPQRALFVFGLMLVEIGQAVEQFAPAILVGGRDQLDLEHVAQLGVLVVRRKHRLQGQRDPLALRVVADQLLEAANGQTARGIGVERVDVVIGGAGGVALLGVGQHSELALEVGQVRGRRVGAIRQGRQLPSENVGQLRVLLGLEVQMRQLVVDPQVVREPLHHVAVDAHGGLGLGQFVAPHGTDLETQ